MGLSTAHAEHCAFCDDFGGKSEIEHFYSKTKQPELAYSWTNLFPACHDCNADKGARSPSLDALRPDQEGFEFKDYLLASQ